MIIAIYSSNEAKPSLYTYNQSNQKVLLGRNPKYQGNSVQQEQQANQNIDCLVVEEPTASRTHLMLKLKNKRLKVIDLGSSNGTKVNEVAIQSNEWVKIKFGDQIKLGQSQGKIIIKKREKEKQSQSSDESEISRSRDKKKKSIQTLFKQLKFSESSLKMLKQMTSQKKSKEQKIKFLKLMGCKNIEAHWQQIEDSLKNRNKYTDNNKKASQQLQKQFEAGRAAHEKKGLGTR